MDEKDKFALDCLKEIQTKNKKMDDLQTEIESLKAEITAIKQFIGL